MKKLKLIAILLMLTQFTLASDSIMHLVAQDNCGVKGQQPNLIKGQPYTFPGDQDSIARNVSFGDEVIYRYKGLNPNAQYSLRLLFLSDDARHQEIFINDNSYGKINLLSNKLTPVNLTIAKEHYTDSQIDLKFKMISGSNAVISSIELYSNDPVIGPLTKITFSANIDSTITGYAFNRLNDTPVPNVDVNITSADQKITTKTGSDGKVIIKLPTSWQLDNPSLNKIKITASKDDYNMETSLNHVEVFGTKISPKPIHTAGVKNPILYLDGKWLFNPKAPEDISTIIKPSADFKNIDVPGEWVMQGFNVEPGTPAAYFKTFNLPTDWATKRIKLHCDTVHGEAKIYVNGQLVGIHDGGFAAFEFDITDQVKSGSNTIAMTIINESTADVLASASQYAVHPLGGITRKIYLKALPEINIANLRVNTTFDKNYCDATLSVQTILANENNSKTSVSVRASLLKNKTSQPLLTKTIDNIKVEDFKNQTININVPNPDKWDPEHPNLYYLQCDLIADNKVIETVTQRFGFRQVEIRSKEVFVNGQPIKLRGVNRHEIDPLRGRSLTDWQWRTDAQLYKQANCNYIRTSHYPPAEEFLDYCDEIGLFVECETALCWVQHGANTNWRQGWNYLDRKIYPYLLQANLENIAFNYNHPSIIIWSLANESRWSPLWRDVLTQVEIFDTSRPNSFHDQCVGTYNNAHSEAQVANFHYPGRGYSPEMIAKHTRPLIFGEYCHLNSYNRRELETDPGIRNAWGEGLRDMWDYMYNSHGMLGGAIWSGIDDTTHLPDGQTVGYGAWGPIDAWRRPKPEYHHVKKTYSPIRLVSQQPTIKGNKIIVDIENRHDFTNTSELDINWKIANRTGKVKSNIAPHSKGSLEIPFTQGDSLILTFTNAAGQMIDDFNLPLTEFKTTVAKASPIKMTSLDNDFIIASNRLKVHAPKLMLLPLSSEGCTQMTPGYKPYPPLTNTVENWKVTTVTKNGDTIKVNAESKSAKGFYSATITDDILDFSYDFEVTEKINPRQWGLVFSLPTDYAKFLTWHRKGIWTTYPDDHIARLNGTAPIFTNDTRVPSTGPTTRPTNPWSQDNTNLGLVDFCSTKTNVYTATLGPDAKDGLTIHANADAHVRCWYDTDSVKMLVAGYSNAGCEGFFRGHASKFDKPLKPGDHIKGTFKITIK
ncbi:MAG: glycoside hydrolase family 2 [Phycisphaerae bacterium]|nr:glycoside hydrolase family 2 [Phycisphaerae bacterium]